MGNRQYFLGSFEIKSIDRGKIFRFGRQNAFQRRKPMIDQLGGRFRPNARKSAPTLSMARCTLSSKFRFIRRLFQTVDIDFPPGQFSGQTGILPFLSQSPGTLVFRHRHPHRPLGSSTSTAPSLAGCRHY